MSEYIEPPTEWTPGVFKLQRAIYLAGSVEGADWRDQLRDQLAAAAPRYAVLSPRVGDPSGVFQAANYSQDPRHIQWEFDHLQRAQRVAFWFRTGEDVPQAYFYLADVLISGKRTAIGLEPGYPRESFIRAEVARKRPDVEIVHTLPALVDAVLRAKMRVPRDTG